MQLSAYEYNRHVVDGVVGLGARDRQGQDHGQRTVRVPGILSHPVKVYGEELCIQNEIAGGLSIYDMLKSLIVLWKS